MKEFLGFKKHLHNSEEEEEFPKYLYHISSGTLTTEYSASLLYEEAVSILIEGFILSKAKLPPSIKRKVNVVRNLQFFDFSGVCQGSEKVPDLALLVANDKGLHEVKFVVLDCLRPTKTSSLITRYGWKVPKQFP
ncbi:hypothetical protein HOY82DRAFT_611898 [Tuber indicum]|nr:hypothetical protein HOY82DRAFT_611898 [Tuber indicum]